MGAYLSYPITEKLSTDEKNDRLKCGASSMQGWRVSQEDAHNAILNFTENVSLFAVYDGHGGKEVAEYTALKLPDILKEIETFKNGDYSEALKEAFLKFDKTLTEPEVIAQLKAIADQRPPGASSTDDEDENIKDLREEASMPIEQLMAKYQANRPVEPLSSPDKGKAVKPGSSAEGASSSSADGVSSSSSVVTAEAASCSSSSGPSCSSVSSSKRVRTSLAEKYSNGEIDDNEAEVDSTDNVVQNGDKEANEEDGDEVVSSSVTKEEEENPSPSKKNFISAKSLKLKQFVSLAEALNDDSSDSDENFPDQEQESSSSAEADDPEAEEEEEDDDDDEEEEEEEEDDEFTMSMSDELVTCLQSGKSMPEALARMQRLGEEDLCDEESGIGTRFLLSCLAGKRPGAESGCTAVVALVLPDRVFVANAGDSRCVASRAGSAVDLSVDHKPEDPLELERITNAGGKVTAEGRVNGGLNLSRALGDHVYKKVANLPLEKQMISSLPDVQELPITDDVEFLVLACDGIWNYMSSQQVIDFVRRRLKKRPEKISSICEELFDHCLAPNTMGDGTGCDNMTAVIVQLKPVPHEPVADTSDENNVNEANSADESPESEGKRRSDDSEAAEAAPSKRTKTDNEDFQKEAP